MVLEKIPQKRIMFRYNIQSYRSGPVPILVLLCGFCDYYREPEFEKTKIRRIRIGLLDFVY